MIIVKNEKYERKSNENLYISPEKLKPWNFGTGLVVKKWLAMQATS